MKIERRSRAALNCANPKSPNDPRWCFVKRPLWVNAQQGCCIEYQWYLRFAIVALTIVMMAFQAVGGVTIGLPRDCVDAQEAGSVKTSRMVSQSRVSRGCGPRLYNVYNWDV